jgi:hypothetical protein
MKFMVTWRVQEDRRHEALKIFAAMSDEEAASEFGDLDVTGRWHDLIGLTISRPRPYWTIKKQEILSEKR